MQEVQHSRRGRKERQYIRHFTAREVHCQAVHKDVEYGVRTWIHLACESSIQADKRRQELQRKRLLLTNNADLRLTEKRHTPTTLNEECAPRRGHLEDPDT
jgi:hypothetical protein